MGLAQSKAKAIVVQPVIGPDLLLAYVVGPAAAVLALAAAEQDESEHRAVDLIRVVPVVRAGAHDDHGAPLALALRELARRLRVPHRRR